MPIVSEEEESVMKGNSTSTERKKVNTSLFSAPNSQESSYLHNKTGSNLMPSKKVTCKISSNSTLFHDTSENEISLSKNSSTKIGERAHEKLIDIQQSNVKSDSEDFMVTTNHIQDKSLNKNLTCSMTSYKLSKPTTTSHQKKNIEECSIPVKGLSRILEKPHELDEDQFSLTGVQNKNKVFIVTDHLSQNYYSLRGKRTHLTSHRTKSNQEKGMALINVAKSSPTVKEKQMQIENTSDNNELSSLQVEKTDGMPRNGSFALSCTFSQDEKIKDELRIKSPVQVIEASAGVNVVAVKVKENEKIISTVDNSGTQNVDIKNSVFKSREFENTAGKTREEEPHLDDHLQCSSFSDASDYQPDRSKSATPTRSDNEHEFDVYGRRQQQVHLPNHFYEQVSSREDPDSQQFNAGIPYQQHQFEYIDYNNHQQYQQQHHYIYPVSMIDAPNQPMYMLQSPAAEYTPTYPMKGYPVAQSFPHNATTQNNEFRYQYQPQQNMKQTFASNSAASPQKFQNYTNSQNVRRSTFSSGNNSKQQQQQQHHRRTNPTPSSANVQSSSGRTYQPNTINNNQRQVGSNAGANNNGGGGGGGNTIQNNTPSLSTSNRSAPDILKTLLRKKACLYESETSQAIALITWLVGRILAMKHGYFSRQQLQAGVHSVVASKISSGVITRTKVNRCMQIILNCCFHYIIPKSEIEDEMSAETFRKSFTSYAVDDSYKVKYLSYPWNDLVVDVILSTIDKELMNSPRYDSPTRGSSQTYATNSPKNHEDDDSKLYATSSKQNADAGKAQQQRKTTVLLCFNENVKSAEDVFRCHNEFIRDVANSSNLFLSAREWKLFFDGGTSVTHTQITTEAPSSGSSAATAPSTPPPLTPSPKLSSLNKSQVPISHFSLPASSWASALTKPKQSSTQQLSPTIHSPFIENFKNEGDIMGQNEDYYGHMSTKELNDFRTSWCAKRYDHDMSKCGFAHVQINHGWLRRDPSKFNYLPQMCPHVYTVEGRNQFIFNSCPKGVQCEFAHSQEEIDYHPSQYKKNSCQSALSNTYSGNFRGKASAACQLRNVCPRRHPINNFKSQYHQQFHGRQSSNNKLHNASENTQQQPSSPTNAKIANSFLPPPTSMLYLSPAPESEFEKSLLLPGLREMFRRRSSVLYKNLHQHKQGFPSTEESSTLNILCSYSLFG